MESLPPPSSKAPLSPVETQRLSVLRSLGILETAREERFDRIVKETQQALNVPIVVITLVEEEHCWFKSEIGIGADRMAREHSICTLCVADQKLLVIENATTDERINQLPMVQAEPGIMFYAGHPLEIQGSIMGTLCILDWKARKLTKQETDTLGILARWVCAELERDQFLQLSRQLEESQARYSAVFHGSPHSVALFTTDGQFLEGNPAAKRIWGPRPDQSDENSTFVGGEAMGHSFRQAALGIPTEVEPFSTILVDGTQVSLQARVQPLRLTDSNDGIIVTLEDVSDSVLAARRQESLLREVTEEKNATLQAHDRLRQFAATLAHELRNPISGLLGYAELLSESPANLDSQMIASIHSCSSTLAHLVDDVLDMERLGQQRLSLAIETFHLGSLVDSVVALYQSQCSSKGIRLSSQIGQACGHVKGDETRVRQVLSNLVSNAVKYTPEGGSISIACHPDDPGYRIEVRDTGIGMTQEAILHMFEPFFQVVGVARDSKHGVGLGLSICQSLIELMDGQIGAESAVGIGSTFWVSLPLPSCQDAKSETPQIGPLAARVLIVDDNPINRRVLELQLGNRGAIVKSVQHGGEALEELRDQTFDVVLMDCQMPVLDGYQTSQQIKADPELYGRPWIVALTGSASNDSEQRCLDAGMDDFLRKPVRCLELCEKVSARIPNDK